MSMFRRNMMKQIPTVQEGWVDKGLARIIDIEDRLGDKSMLKFIEFIIPNFGENEIKEYYKPPKVCDLNKYHGISFYANKRNRMNNYYSSIKNLDISDLDTSSFKYTRYDDYNDAFGMFYYCDIENIIGLDKIDTKNIVEFSGILMKLNFVFAGGQMFTKTKSKCILKTNNIGNIDTSNAISMVNMFGSPYIDYLEQVTDIEAYKSLISVSINDLDISKFDVKNVKHIDGMFQNQHSLSHISIPDFNLSNLSSFNNVFKGCLSLNKITCKQSFKDWCITNQDVIALPEAMREGGNGTWEIVN